MDGGCVPSQVLKNAKPLVANEKNDKVVTAYNTDIMEQGKTSNVIRGPSFYQTNCVQKIKKKRHFFDIFIN